MAFENSLNQLTMKNNNKNKEREKKTDLKINDYHFNDYLQAKLLRFSFIVFCIAIVSLSRLNYNGENNLMTCIALYYYSEIKDEFNDA